MMLRRLALIAIALGTGVLTLAFLLLTTLLSAHAGESAVPLSMPDRGAAQQPTSLTLAAAEACGSGEQLPPWTICLYGEVSQVDTGGHVHVLANAPVTISLGSRVVTGTTFLRPGDTAPSYEIDISPLKPNFLQPVTLTASLSGTLVQRHVVVFPNFDTHSQHFDVQLSQVGSLDPAPLWGYVVDFKAGGPVAGAEVIAAHAGHPPVTVTTTAPNTATLPIYTLTADNLASIGALPGSTITVTARYRQDVDRQVIQLRDEAQQVNFVTGWRCDGYNPLPQVGGHGGLPQVGGHGGLPDVACLWGYGLVSGAPRAGMDVTVEISGTVFAGRTRDLPGELLPRYGIALPGASVLVGQPMTITGVYSGYASTAYASMALDTEQSQRVDVHAAEITAMSFSTVNVSDVVWHAGYLWAGTSGGLVRWDPFAQPPAYVHVPIPNGHPYNMVSDIELVTTGAMSRTMWLATSNGASHYNPFTGVWLDHVSTEEGLRTSGVSDLAIDPTDGSVWFGSSEGACHYHPDLRRCEPIDPPGLTRFVTTLAVGHDGSVWFGSSSAAADVVRYFPDTSPPQWVTYTYASGVLPHPYVHDIMVATDGSVYIGTVAGVAHYVPGASPEWTTHNIGAVRSITKGVNGTLWFGVNDTYRFYSALIHYVPGGQPEWQVIENGLANGSVGAIAEHEDGTFWFGTTGGVGQYAEGATPEWLLLQTNGLSDNRVRALAIDGQGTLWAGTLAGLDRYDSDGGWENLDVCAIFDTQGSDCEASTMAVADDGTLWVGSNLGVAHHVPGDDPPWHPYHLGDGLPLAPVWDIAPYPDGSVWIGTSTGVSHLTPGDPPVWETYTTTHGLVPGQIRAVGVGTDGSLWFGSGGFPGYGGLSHYTPTTRDWETITWGFVPYNTFGDIAMAPDGSMWFAGSRDTFHYTPSTNEWEAFYNQWIPFGCSPNRFYVDDNNTLWFVNGASSVCRYDRDAVPQWEKYGEAHGIPDARTNSIIPDGADAFWVGTDGGLVHWTPPVRQSDVAVRLQGPASVHAGDLLTYTLSVKNHGQVASRNTGLTLTLPVGLNYMTATPSPASSSPITWNLGALAYNSVVTVTLIASVDSGLSSGVALTATASVTTTSPETYLTNNTARLVSLVRSPDRSDVRASLAGPPLLIPGSDVAYTLWVDNDDELDAADTLVTVALPAGLTYQAATPPPATGLTWELGTLPGLAAAQPITLIVHVNDGIAPGVTLAVSAVASTSSPESNTANNTASSTIATSLTDAQTLILVAPDRLAARYGASQLLTKLYEFAQHSNVQGAVVDVARDPLVRQSFQQWDAEPASWLAANQVAESIKALIDRYTIAYPNLRYLVIVGGDEVIPFYRVADQNPTQWHERTYRAVVPDGSVRAALAADRLLTDDFYADRDPTLPASTFWPDDHWMYLPDFALGRLVESPQEIMAALDAFLLSNGTVDLGPAIVGGDPQLADDLQQAQCSLLQQDGLPADLCTTDGSLIRNHFLGQPTGSAWMALHSNHFSSGPLLATSVAQSFQSYAGDLMVNIGCHAGLNVGADQSALPSLDMVQAMLGKGGVVVGPTAYSYASPFGVELSERLAVDLAEALLEGASQEIGAALVTAKQAYYTAHEGWFSYLDEKVLLPVTLYGPPMYRVNTSGTDVNGATKMDLPFTASVTTEPTNSSIVTYTLSEPSYTRHDVPTGTYFDLRGEVLAQDGLPVQPAGSRVISSTIDGQTPRGIVLREASYTTLSPFDPVISQSWAAGSTVTPDRQESPASFSGWDRPVPYALGHFSGLVDNAASLNLVTGLFNHDTQSEQLFSRMVLEVRFSADDDDVPPQITETHAYASNTYAEVFATTVDDEGVDEVVAVCDNGAGQWQTTSLSQAFGVWQGLCQRPVSKVYVQAIDHAGNVSASEWFLPNELPPLAVTLVDFRAVCNPFGTEVTWETVSEINARGFNIWRGPSPSEPFERLNGALIPSQSPGGSQGAVYSWFDETAEPGIEYWYWLEAIDLGNRATRFGPVGTLCQVPTAVRLSDFGVGDAVSGVLPPTWQLLALVAGALVLVVVKRMR